MQGTFLSGSGRSPLLWNGNESIMQSFNGNYVSKQCILEHLIMLEFGEERTYVVANNITPQVSAA